MSLCISIILFVDGIDGTSWSGGDSFCAIEMANPCVVGTCFSKNTSMHLDVMNQHINGSCNVTYNNSI